MEPEEFLPLTVDAGFYVMVHQSGAQEEVFDNAVYAPPGATTYIGVSKVTEEVLIYLANSQKRRTRRGAARPRLSVLPLTSSFVWLLALRLPRSSYVHPWRPASSNICSLPWQVSSLFRNIGGLMGVYLGYSSLQIFHVLDVLVDGAYSTLSGVWGRYVRTRQRRRGPDRHRPPPRPAVPEDAHYPVTAEPLYRL
ncbi:hypothetical protein HPB48_009972 [Haemaphysalis longicornis]|uniref:Uncharacterized protein n=1 Tax=Haemaphysalis longicornis TaxID=44386 RepID=A0A9J6FZ20_HAELO|nr:hypothetical protein HPB48_009972 [Haemaphysalis longicornis]